MHSKINPSIKNLDIESMPDIKASIIFWIAYFLSPYKKILLPFLFFRTIRFTIIFSFPAFVGLTIDGIIKYQNGFFSSEIFYFSLIYLFCYTLLLATPFLFIYESMSYENANRSLSLLGISLLNTASTDWHLQNSNGKKVDYIEGARSALNDLMILFRWQLVPLVGTILSSFVLIFIFDGPLYYVLIFIAFTASFIFSSLQLGKRLSILYPEYREMNAKVISRFYEMSSSFLTIRSLSLGSYIENRASDEIYNARNHIIKIIRATLKKWTILNILTCAFLLVLLIKGYVDLTNGVLTPGLFSALLLMFFSLSNGLDGLSVAQDKIYDYLSSLKRFARFCSSIRESNALSQEVPLKYSENKNVPLTFEKLELNEICFSYSEKETATRTLNSISFILEKNKKLALVGLSGAGKSTLVKIILGLYKPQEGSMYLNGIDSSTILREDWIQAFAYVPQEIEIFEGTIRENIMLGLVDSEDQYQKAILRSNLNIFIEELPEGDLTLVGERGLKLSGGQRQRIGIARALMRNALVLILDEASSALDSITEMKIQNTLFEELEDITIIIIAHRLSTIKRADHILVMDHGEIIESGTFDDLKENNGQFALMWERARI